MTRRLPQIAQEFEKFPSRGEMGSGVSGVGEGEEGGGRGAKERVSLEIIDDSRSARGHCMHRSLP